MGVITPNLTRIIRSNEGRKHSGCKAKRHLPKRSFDADFWHSSMGISNLSTSITLNGTTVAAACYYDSANLVVNNTAHTCSWPCTMGSRTLNELSERGDATDITTGHINPISGASDLVKFPGGGPGTFESIYDYYITPTDALSLDLSSGTVRDFIFEFTGIICSAGTLFNCGGYYYDPGESPPYLWGGGAGYRVWIDSSNRLSLYLANTEAPEVKVTSTSTLTLAYPAYYHFLICGNRDGDVTFFVNGVFAGSSSIAAITKRIYANSSYFRIGGADHQPHVEFDTAATWYCNHFALWKLAAWFPGDTLTLNELAIDRYADLMQLHPDYCNGTALARSL